jgi:hypothetical protein
MDQRRHSREGRDGTLTNAREVRPMVTRTVQKCSFRTGTWFPGERSHMKSRRRGKRCARVCRLTTFRVLDGYHFGFEPRFEMDYQVPRYVFVTAKYEETVMCSSIVLFHFSYY